MCENTSSALSAPRSVLGKTKDLSYQGYVFSEVNPEPPPWAFRARLVPDEEMHAGEWQEGLTSSSWVWNCGKGAPRTRLVPRPLALSTNERRFFNLSRDHWASWEELVLGLKDRWGHPNPDQMCHELAWWCREQSWERSLRGQTQAFEVNSSAQI